jgi:hypothetical protein
MGKLFKILILTSVVIYPIASIAQFNGCPKGFCVFDAAPPPTCINSLDYSVQCNSQFFPLLSM